MDTGPIAIAANLTTTLAAAFNAAALLGRRTAALTPARRAAIAAIVCVNAGIAIEAMASQAMFAAWRAGAGIDVYFAPGAWTAARAPLLAGTLAMSALILRRPR